MEGRKKNMEGGRGTERERVIRYDIHIIHTEREGEREGRGMVTERERVIRHDRQIIHREREREGGRERETETEGWKAERRIWKGGGVQSERESYTA